MNDSELHYSQCEKEMLAVYFGCNKFHRYIYGMPVVEVHTDHKPLTTIIQKHINKIGSIRLQRFRLKLLRYNLNLIYVPGKNLHFPDMLSRNSIKETEDDPEMLEMVHSVSKHMPLTSEQRTRLRLATAMDSQLSQVKEFCLNKWPENSKLSSNLISFAKIKENLYTEAGILFYGSKIVVPTSLREVISNSLHKGHPGITKMLQKARQLYFWPKMSEDLNKTMKMCRTCEKFSKQDRNEPLLPHKIPELRFQKVACDIVEFGHKNYLVLVDYFSHWIELRPLKNKSSSSIINELQEICSRFGYPQEIVADNNPFASFECKKYYSAKGIIITNSTPHYPKSNGMAESADNNTPISGLNCSPSQILNSRMLRTELPVSTECLQPMIQNNIPQLLKIKQGITKKWHDQHRLKKETNYKDGDNIVFRTRNDVHWQKGRVISKGKEPRSYWISRDVDEKHLRRNTSQMKKSYTTSAPKDRDVPPEMLFLPDLTGNCNNKVTRNGFHDEAVHQQQSATKGSHPDVKTSRYGRQIIKPKRLDL